MESTANLFAHRAIPRPSKTRETRKGILITGFLAKLNPSRIAEGYPPYAFGRLARMLKNIPPARLDVIKGACDDAERTGFP